MGVLTTRALLFQGNVGCMSGGVWVSGRSVLSWSLASHSLLGEGVISQCMSQLEHVHDK